MILGILFASGMTNIEMLFSPPKKYAYNYSNCCFFQTRYLENYEDVTHILTETTA